MKNSGFRAFICVILILSFVSSSAVYGLAEGVEPTETVQAVEVVEEATDLSIGSKGDQVVSLQQRLYQLGFFTSAIDGDFGNNTMAAVQEAKSYWRELEQKKIDQYIASLTPAPTQTPEPFTPYPADDESFVEEVQAVEILPTDT
ncbi:MAG: peptidoglycan-binding protein [Clostridia bacterium]|nr:peptidoglycan-binding protein [Clostridia bacterium]